MRRVSPLLLVILAVLATVLAAGCGGSAGDDFESSVVDSRNAVDGALTHITDNPSSKEDLLNRMEQAGLRIDKAAATLEQENTPEELEDDRAKLVRAYRQLAVDVSAAAEELRQPEFQNLVQGARGLSFESWNQANNVLANLREQGIDVEPLGKH
jgi:hypothetical protein